MKITRILLLLLLLALPLAVPAEAPGPAESALLLALENPESYLSGADLDAIARAPQEHLGVKLLLRGSVLAVLGEAPQFEYALSPEKDPARVFVVRYSLQQGQPLILPGDKVTAYATLTGAEPFTGSLALSEGAPILDAALLIPTLPEPAPAGHPATREDPAPSNTAVITAGSRFSDYASYEITILSTRRGSQALSLVRDMSKYNINPTRRQEYFLIQVRVKALETPAGRAPLGPENFAFVSAQGAEYRQHFLINPPSYLTPLYEGGEQTAWLACLIDKEDRPLVVFLPQSPRPAWFDPSR